MMKLVNVNHVREHEVVQKTIRDMVDNEICYSLTSNKYTLRINASTYLLLVSTGDTVNTYHNYNYNEQVRELYDNEIITIEFSKTKNPELIMATVETAPPQPESPAWHSNEESDEDGEWIEDRLWQNGEITDCEATDVKDCDSCRYIDKECKV